MDTEALRLSRNLKADGLAERLNWGAVELSVTDLDRAIQFWTGALGFVRRPDRGTGVALGTAERTLVILRPGASLPVLRGVTGMYHVAFGVPSQVEFSRLLSRFQRLRLPVSPVDHTMSKAIYLNDPDGHGIEIAFETPERFLRFDNSGGQFAMIDSEGRMRSGRDPLDLQAEFAAAKGTDETASIAAGTIVAHVHFHVPELEPALSWFEKLGFVRNLTLPSMGMADMGAGASYTHRLAVNLWAGRGARRAPDHSARLLCYHLTTSDGMLFEEAGRHLQQDGRGNLTGVDPVGITMTLSLSAALRSEAACA
ncbi:VOC family protein [Rhizobium sp. FKY42]|uniref:VOC family protein n=1 Tax=Rhizobium sp. FKY42 TaxID=2562310 RepID=UPI0010C09960|nr:VOC family protein [Rhizobium sp. FKY42]